MADATILVPVDDDSPCGEDLKWDMGFMTLMQDYELLIAQDRGGVIEGETAVSEVPDSGDFIVRVNRLCERTKDLRLLVVRAAAFWQNGGLPAFAEALEELVAACEQWSDPESGIYPRADEYDGDLGERIAALSKLLGQIPILADTTGWGTGNPTLEERQQTTVALQAVFDTWSSRLGAALGDDIPSRNDAWEAIKKLLPTSTPVVESEDGAEIEATPPSADAWDLVERAAELMTTQDRHSPALPVLHLLLTWRSGGILEIAEKMRQSGLTMEQLLDSIRKQLEG